MKTKITPIQAEEALDAISKIEVKTLNSGAGYALTKNTLSLTRVVKDHHKWRKETRAAIAAPGEKVEEPQAAALAQQWALAADTEVETNLYRIKLTDLTRNCAVKDLTLLSAIDFLIEDDLPLDDAPVSE